MNTHSRLVLLLLALAVVASCGAVEATHPQVVVDETACSHCRMLVSDPRHAAGVVGADGSEYVYDDIVCLIAAGQASQQGATTWFHSFDADEWTLAGQTAFVEQQKVRGPMGGTVLAFATAERAAEAARSLQGRTIASLSELESKGDHR